MTILYPLNTSATRRSAAVVTAIASVALAACVGPSSPPVQGNPVITFTLDSTVPAGDTIHGEVVATGDQDLTSLSVSVFDTAGVDSTGQVVVGGSAVNASRLDAKFAWKVLHTAPGGYVRFSAFAFNTFGDSTIVRDSTRVTP
jgi:hypothetical protein